MSGEAGGLILLPLAISALPFVLGGLAVAGIAAGAAKAGSAAKEYERQQRQQRDEIRKSSAAKDIGNFREEMQQSMAEQTRLNIETSDQMMQQLDMQRTQIQQAAQNCNPQQFQEYTAKLKQQHQSTMNTIHNAQAAFNTAYHEKIALSMGKVSRKINTQYASYIDELRQMQADEAAKNQYAKELASSYIEETKTLVYALSHDFDGRKFSGRQLSVLTEQLDQAIAQFNRQNYESAIASAKDVAIGTLEEIYEADAKKQEWENYYKLALVLSDEVLGYINAQATITSEMAEQAERTAGKPLEGEIVGVEISEYTGRNKKGQTQFEYIRQKAQKAYAKLRGPDAQKLTTSQLKDYVNFLNDEVYPAAASCISMGIINMNNAFSRQNISEEIIDFFEEHNFTFNGYAYDDDRHDKALHIGLENQATGEELIVSLSPELCAPGDIQTRVDIRQIKGDEANEERKAYYRTCVKDVMKGISPYAKVSLKCNESTKGKLSTDTDLKRRLQK